MDGPVDCGKEGEKEEEVGGSRPLTCNDVRCLRCTGAERRKEGEIAGEQSEAGPISGGVRCVPDKGSSAKAAARQAKDGVCGEEEEQQDCSEHPDRPPKLVRAGAEDGVEGGEVPLRDNVGRRYQRIGREEVIGMAQKVGKVEGEELCRNKEGDKDEGILVGEVRMERDLQRGLR